MDYTITLTEAEDKAMQYITTSPLNWIEDSTHNRARKAIDEICRIYTEYKLNRNEPITAVGKDAMVLSAFSEGVVLLASQREVNEEAEARALVSE